jgi:hypothetical protein
MASTASGRRALDINARQDGFDPCEILSDKRDCGRAKVFLDPIEPARAEV